MRGLLVSPAAAWLAAGAIFLGISRFHQYFVPLGRIQAPMLCAVGALILMISGAHRWRPGGLLEHWIPRSLGYILLLAFVGIPFGVFPSRSFDFLNEAFSRTLLLGVMAWAVSRTPDGLRFMTKVITAGGLTAVVQAVLTDRKDNAGRLAGSHTYDPNDLALIAVITLPLVVWWIADRRNRGRFLLLPFIPLIFYVLVETDSRGGFLAAASVIIGLIVLGFSGASPKLRKLATCAIILAVVSVPLLPADYVANLQTITKEDDYNRTSDSGRIAVWRRGIGYALDNPVLGVGIGGFNAAEGRSDLAQQRAQEGRGFKWSAAHSAYVQVLAELGFIGGGLFIYLLLRTILSLAALARQQRRVSPSHVDLLPALLAISFIGYAVGAMFLSFAYYDVVYILLAVACATLMQARPSAMLPRAAASTRTRGLPTRG